MWDSVFNLFTFCSGLHHDNPKAAIQFITEKSVANIANGDGKTEEGEDMTQVLKVRAYEETQCAWRAAGKRSYEILRPHEV